MPSTAKTHKEVQFFLFFLIESNQSYASAQIAEIEEQNRATIILITIIILSGFSAVLAANLFIAMRTAGGITNAIDVMTKYTNLLKMAPNVEGKRKIIAEISNDSLFVKTSEVYKKMRLAKKALFYRYK